MFIQPHIAGICKCVAPGRALHVQASHRQGSGVKKGGQTKVDGLHRGCVVRGQEQEVLCREQCLKCDVMWRGVAWRGVAGELRCGHQCFANAPIPPTRPRPPMRPPKLHSKPTPTQVSQPHSSLRGLSTHATLTWLDVPVDDVLGVAHRQRAQHGPHEASHLQHRAGKAMA